MLSDLAPLPGDETPTTTTTPESISDGTTSTPESISDGQNHLSPQDVALPAPNTADSRYRELPATTHLEAMPSLDNNQGNFLLPSDFSPLPSGETPTTITPQSISDGENHPAAQDVVLPDPNTADSRYRALPDGTFSCNMCVRVCRRENNIRRHVTHQHPMPGFPVPRYPCDHPGCGKSYAFPGELAAHKRKDHEGKPAQKRKMKAKASDEIYWCNYSDVCRKIFKTVQGIEAHLNKVHNVDVQMSGLLVREMVPTLSGPHDPVPGPSRERNEPNVPPLKRRKMNLKVPDKIYRCKYFPVCKKEYKMWGRFRNHMRNVHMEVVEMAD
ncbi:hypothetical protein PTTG_25557 [Puccinia triticina 1-1 BBBD Race 1]|uniref:C2H2-type domain-containing protein n=1 Tax=Puccinia triticina (isolate 1-1 / race 1 (BBBD)) TaxID=630390 RepID=A0A180H297_PUCT1|nr:hypothetical protein PTTG_25557 [Puccinia triticina 1-1 BBBD Race 1]